MVTTLFGAIGYLKHHGVLKNEFCFPDTTVPVFRTFICNSPAGSPLSSPPSSPKPPSLSAAMGVASPLSAPSSPQLQLPAPAPVQHDLIAPLSPNNKHRLRDDACELLEKQEQPLKRSRVMEVSSLLA